EEERGHLSNTIELWDAVPKYSVSRYRQAKMRKGGALKILKQSFRFRGTEYRMVLQPAKIETEQGEMEFYPSEREELIEDALRKMACQKGLGFMDRDGSGVFFTMAGLRRLLSEYGHTMSYPRIVESLQIMNRCTLQISLHGERNAFYSASIFPEIGAVSRDDWEKDPSAKWFVRFSPLVSKSIMDVTYRQLDLKRMMSHPMQLARWLHKRMAHLYIQASMLHPYGIRLSTILRDSGLLSYKEVRYAAREVEKALKILKEGEVITSYEAKKEYVKRSLVDVHYALYPHPIFVRQAKASNKRMRVHACAVKE
ncbi:MAG: hypothetical protein D6819_05525, partial [Gammaproteobacteria bacterium]